MAATTENRSALAHRHITGDSLPNEHQVKWQLLAQLGITSYRLQAPDVLSPDMIAAFDLAPPNQEAANNEAQLAEPAQSLPEQTQSSQAEAKKAASEEVNRTASQPSKAQIIDNLRTVLNSDSSEPAEPPEPHTQPRNSAATPSQATPSQATPSGKNGLDTTDKLAVETSLYAALPGWLWQDVLALLDISAEQVLPFEPNQPLSHTRQARFIICKTPQAALFASNILGIDEALLTGLSGDKTSDRHRQAKQQLWQLLRTLFGQ